MTARQHAAARRAAPFGSYRRAPGGEAEWKKLGHGYIGVTDGSKKGYVAPGLIFAVEIHNNTPEIRSYTKRGEGLECLKPYAVGTLYHLLSDDTLWKSKAITFDEMISSVKRLYNDAKMPTRSEFWQEFGIFYDKETFTAKNILNLDDDYD